MSDDPENDKRGAFIRDLIDLRDRMVRNANDDIPISDVIDRLFVLHIDIYVQLYIIMLSSLTVILCTLSTI